jgi:hypothetical protein
MLDVQRNRGSRFRAEIDYTRKVLWTHMILGAVVITLFLFHACFAWFAGAILWYAISLMVLYGYMGERVYCRWMLALVFLAGTAAGLYFVNRVYPGSTPSRAAMLPHAFIPIWGGLVSLAYAIGALLLLFDARIRRAGQVTFTLW